MTSPFNISEITALQTVGWVALHFIWQGLAIGAVAAISLRFLLNARDRYTSLCGALVLLLAAPVITAAALTTHSATGSWVQANLSGSIDIPFAYEIIATQGSPDAWNAVDAATPYVAVLWLVGMAVLCLQRLGGCWFLHRIRRQAHPAEAKWQEVVDRLAARVGLRSAAPLLVGIHLDTPAVIGWLRPVILCPASVFSGLPLDQLESILLHELFHLRRCDHWVNAAQSVAETLLFFHPVVWWVSRQLATEREYCCDDDGAMRVVGPTDHHTAARRRTS